ncbi:hypothetical protein BV898_11501 [Hypsibius exemplaris]|uniref:SLC26A/SulP transporter domain-containing protein n=1 Tax=Hypsibius exemplaris TaxID=2072580 RepID=A0A1W0WGD3_HYPEX|nr:hypothetical protein BV898_11501 [Hypsibius exemplaris]
MAAENYKPLAPWTQLHRSLRTRIVGRIRRFRCSAGCMKNQIVSAFPILDWLLNYKIRSCLMGDVISGFTVGIMNIPQGMAYGVLSGVESINGL